MNHAVDDLLIRAFPAAPWLFQPAAPDAVAVLTEALGEDWSVVRESNCEGETSIIALSTVEADEMPTIILYEKDGKANVATVRDDEWCDERSFRKFPQAVATFISIARTAQADFWSGAVWPSRQAEVVASGQPDEG